MPLVANITVFMKRVIYCIKQTLVDLVGVVILWLKNMQLRVQVIPEFIQG